MDFLLGVDGERYLGQNGLRLHRTYKINIFWCLWIQISFWVVRGRHPPVSAIGETLGTEYIEETASITKSSSLCFGYKCLTQLSLGALYCGSAPKARKAPSCT